MVDRIRLMLIACGLCVVLLLSACNSDDGNGIGNNAERGGEPSDDGEVVELTFMGWEASPLETEAVRRGLETFMEQNPEIRVEYTPVPGDQYATRLLTQLAGNSAPDVFFLGATEYRAFQQRDVLLDLTDYFNREYTLDDFIPSAAEIMNINGSIYGVSSCTVSPVLYYNKALFDEAGVPYPPSNPDEAWSWEQFLEVAGELTIEDNGTIVQYGIYGLENDHAMTLAQIMTNDANLFDSNFTASTINTPEVMEVLEAIRDLRVEYRYAPEASFQENSGMNPSQMLQTGRVAMLVTGSWALQELAQMDFEVGIGVLPAFSVPATQGQAHVHAAAKNTDHPDAAWKLIDFLSSEQYQIDLISEGLWMPNRVALYEADGVERWYNEEVHPAGFRELIPYIREAEVHPYTMLYTNEILTTTIDELERFWYDNEPVKDVVADIERKVNELLAESQVQ